MLEAAHGPFEQLKELARAISADDWMLVGGLMVRIHAELHGVAHTPAHD